MRCTDQQTTIPRAARSSLETDSITEYRALFLQLYFAILNIYLISYLYQSVYMP